MDTTSLYLAKPEDGRAPKTRIEKPEDAYALAQTLIYAAEGRLDKARMVRGLLDGNTPWSAQKLLANGQAWRANFPTLEASAVKNSAKIPFYDLFSSSAPIVSVQLDTDDYNKTNWDRSSAQFFHEFFYGYKTLESHIWTMLDDFITFNKGFFWWPHPGDPYFKRLPWWRVMFPDGTGTDSEEWEVFAVKQFYTVSRLWSFRDMPGWDNEAIDRAVARANPILPQSMYGEAIEVQQGIKDCDITYSARTAMIRCVSIYVKEFDGSWSHLVVEEEALTAARLDSMGQSKEKPRLLYRANSIYDGPEQIIAPFIYEENEGSMNAFDGLGKQIFPLLATKDRLVNGIVDGAFIRQYPMVQAVDASGYTKAGMVQIGPTSVLPAGVNVIPTHTLADLEGPMGVTAMLDRLQESNTSIFKPRLEKPSGNPETATATNLRFQHASILTNSAVNRFDSQMDRFLGELWRRLTLDHGKSSSRPGIKAAIKFQKKCKEAGIPIETLRKTPISIMKTRVLGNGSIMGRQQVVQGLIPASGMFGPRGRMAFWQDYTAAYAGQVGVQRYFPDEDLLKIPGVQEWMADRENVDMQAGSTPLIGEGQDHRIHVDSHMKAAVGGLQGIQQGADPMGVLAFLQTALPHIAQHVAFLPPTEQKEAVKQLQELNKAAAEVMQAVQQQQEQAAKQQQQGQQMTFEQQLRMMETQNDIAIKNMKTEAMMKQREQKAEFDKELADRMAAAQINRDTAVTAAKIRTDSLLPSLRNGDK